MQKLHGLNVQIDVWLSIRCTRKGILYFRDKQFWSF